MERRRSTCALALFLCVALSPSIASAFGVTLTPIGGSTTGVVGDTISIGIDLVIGDDEFLTIADPAITWDLEGGNVLDAVGASQPSVVWLGSIPLSPLAAERWNFFDPTIPGDVGPGVFGNGPFDDPYDGPTAFWGFEMTSILISDGQLLDYWSDGTFVPGTYRIGTLDFLLASVGTTTIGFAGPALSHERPFGSLFTGRGVERISLDEIDFIDLDITSGAFASLAITVVPEPGTALLLGLGLAGLSSAGRRR